MMTTRPGIAAVNYDGRVASCRAAGPTDHACGPDTFPFLDRPTGEVGARRAFGPSPPGTSEVAHPSKGKRDDGGLAWTYGASARKPSAPETYGGLVWNNPAGRGSTRGEDSTGRDEDAAEDEQRGRARFAARTGGVQRVAGRERGAGGGAAAHNAAARRNGARRDRAHAVPGGGLAGPGPREGPDPGTAGWGRPSRSRAPRGGRGAGGRTPRLRAVLGGGGRIDSWPVLAFGAKWIISGRQREFDADGRPTSQMHSYGTVCNLCIG